MYLPRETPRTNCDIADRSLSFPDQSPECDWPGASALDARVIELRHEIPPDNAPESVNAFRPTSASTIANARAFLRRLQTHGSNLVHRWPGFTILLCAAVVWFIVNEQHSIVEEQLESRIRELSAQLEMRKQVRAEKDTSAAAFDVATPSGTSDKPPLETASAPQAIVQKRFVFDGSERDDPFVGPQDAPVLVMVMTDLQCERCGTYYRDVLLPLLQSMRGVRDTKFMLRDLPLPNNQHAEEAAQLAQCAGEQSRYFEALDAILAEPRKVQAGDLLAIAHAIKVDHPDRLIRCLQSRRYADEIARDRTFSLALGATGVPTTFVGRRDSDGSFSGELIRGAQPRGVIEGSLKRAGSSVELPK